MITKKINENCYGIEIYDWIESHDDYIVGFVKRNPAAGEDDECGYWHFCVNNNVPPINAGDLTKISTFIRELNSV